MNYFFDIPISLASRFYSFVPHVFRRGIWLTYWERFPIGSGVTRSEPIQTPVASVLWFVDMIGDWEGALKAHHKRVKESRDRSCNHSRTFPCINWYRRLPFFKAMRVSPSNFGTEWLGAYCASRWDGRKCTLFSLLIRLTCRDGVLFRVGSVAELLWCSNI